MKRKTKIIHNRARCKLCGEILESKYTHDFEACKCFRETNGQKGIAVDGGQEYLRRAGYPEYCENMNETRLYTDEERDEYNRHMELIAEQFGWTTIDYME